MSGQFDGALTLKEGDHTVYGSADAVMAVSAIITQRADLLEALELAEKLIRDDIENGDHFNSRNVADYNDHMVISAAIAKARGEK